MDKKTFNYVEPIQIRFNDVDGQQHVNNSVYQQYYDIGRAGYFSEISGTNYQTGGQSVVIVSVQTNFNSPIFYHDKIQVETRVSKIGNKSLTMEQLITDRKTGEIKSDCKTVLVGFDYNRQESIPIPEDLRNMIADFENF